MNADKIIDDIFGLYMNYGMADYIGEPVSQIEHMSQAAQLAIEEGYDDEVVLAAFFHDIGHICAMANAENNMNGFGVKSHEKIGADFLRKNGFPEKVARLVENHVQAKRFLTFKFPEYYNKLSDASKKTLEFQGGKMTEAEAQRFEQDPLLIESIRMRYWDEMAKETNVPLIDLEKLKLIAKTVIEKKHPIKMVVFDMAGTVIDEDNVVYKTLQKAINEEGYNFSLDLVLLEGAGKEKSQAIKDILKKHALVCNQACVNRVFENFKTYLDDAYNTIEIKSQPGAEELFKELKRRGIYVVLNTGYDSKTAHSIISKVGWEEGNHFDCMVTAGDVINNRPNPDMIEFAMEKVGLIDSKQIVKVGDSIIDIVEGKNAGCYLTVGITTGAQTKEQLLKGNPDYVIDSLLEILPLIDGAQKATQNIIN